MKNVLDSYVEKFRHMRRTRRRAVTILAALAFAVSCGVFWELHTDGVAMVNETFCGMEEHTHTDDCYYEEQLICKTPEHTHDLSCLNDDTADVETATDWESTLPKEMTGIWAEDVAAVAGSQVGYAESASNFQLDEDGATRHGYTRYGAWYGNEYGDWDAMFVSFCLHYAGVPENKFPESSGVYAWKTELDKQGIYVNAADYEPKAGDVVFLDKDKDGAADHVGIVEEVSNRGDKIKVIEGDCEDTVKEKAYPSGSKEIAGYGILPGDDGDQGTDSSVEVPALMQQTVEAVIGTAESSAKAISASDSITLSGMLPVHAGVTAEPVDVNLDGIRILAAYDITIYDENGEEFEPENGQIHVSISNESIRESLDDDGEPLVYHIDGETSEMEEIPVTGAKDGTVEFEAEDFSVYIVGEDEKYYDVETGEVITVYTIEFYQYEFDASDDDTSRGPNRVSTQHAAEGDTLKEPAVPSYEHHAFDGWYTQMQDAADHEPGSQYDFSRTLGENLAEWGPDYELGEHHTIRLYTDYDPVYYVYFMTEEDPVLDPSEVNYAPYVFHTDTYHEKDSALDTSTVDVLYWQQYLQVEQDEGDLTTYAVVDWYYYEDGAAHTEENRKYISSEDLTDQDGIFRVTDDLTLYPVIEDAIWIYFDMCIRDSSEIYMDPSPAFVLANAQTVGDVLPDAVRPGYTFDGWFTETENGTKITADTSVSRLRTYMQNGIVTLYAHWTPAKVGYTINIWRQKATDGQLGLDHKVVQSGEEYNTYIQYYDYAQSIIISADDDIALTTGDTNLSAGSFTYTHTSWLPWITETEDYWSEWTGYGWKDGNNGTDGTGDYTGFVYNQARTENDLATKTIAGDGSTIINIFYDRVTVTYHFGTSSRPDATGTMIGLYDTNITPLNGSNPGGTLSAWPDPGTRKSWRFQRTSDNTNGYQVMSFLAKFALQENYKYRSNILYFTSESANHTVTLYYYLEVTNPDKQLTGSSQTKTIGGVTYVLDQRTSIAFSTDTLTFYFSDKYIGYEYVGYTFTSIATYMHSGSSALVLNRSSLYIFNKAKTYTIDLYSNHNGEKLVESRSFKYGEDLTGYMLPEELDAAEYGPVYYYQFTGKWYDDPTFTSEFLKPDTMPGNNLVAYADWEPKDITVTFRSAVESDLYELLAASCGEYDQETNPGGVMKHDDGSYSIIIKAGTSVPDTLSELAAVVEGTGTDRYTFVCWMYGTKIFNISSRLYDDTMITASWKDIEKEHHTLTYDLNLGEDYPYDGERTYCDGIGHTTDEESGEWLKKIEDVFEKLEEAQINKFICWNTQPDGSGMDYYPDELYSFVNDYDDVTLYARWAAELTSVLHVHFNYPDGYHEEVEGEKSEYDLDYTVDNLGTVDLSGISVLDGDGDEITVNGVTYRFIGWSTYEDAHTEADVKIEKDATVAVDGIDTDGKRINNIYGVWLAELSFSIIKTNTAGEPVDGAVFTLTCNASSGAGGGTSGPTYYFSYDKGTETGSWSEDYAAITLGGVSFTDHAGDLDGSEIFTLTEIAAPDGYEELSGAIVFTLNTANSDVQILTNAGSRDDPSKELASAAGNILTVRNEGGTCPVDVIKYTKDEDTGEITLLPGAGFVLSRIETLTDPNSGETEETLYYGVFMQTTEEVQDCGIINYYTLTDWTTNKADATVLMSGDDGFIHVLNLDTGSYYLTETRAPDGFMLLDDSVSFVICGGGYVTEDTVNNAGIWKDSDSITLYISNYPGAELPNTGGTGTSVFILSGMLLAGCAAGFLYRKKKYGSCRMSSFG